MCRRPSILCLSWWNKNKCNSKWVTLVKPKWMFLPMSCSFFLAAKKWEREVSWNQIWAKIQWKPESKVWESLRESEWMRVECESSTPTPRPLFKERMAGHRWRRQASTASDRWRKVGPLAVGKGPADPRVRPNPRWPTALLTVICILSFGAGQTFLRKDVQIYFSKDFNARKYFWIFYKKKKKC